jgi:hypothetical protein
VAQSTGDTGRTGTDRPADGRDGEKRTDEPTSTRTAPAADDRPDGPADAHGGGEPADAEGGASPAGAGRGWLTGGVAVLAWLVATPVAFVLPGVLGGDPFANGAATLPLAAAFLLVAVFLLVALRWRGQVVAGAAAGLAAAWTVLMLRTSLHGTPFGFAGLIGDMGRMSASVTRYTVTVASSDTLVKGLPSEYPPFYAWLVGRASVLTGEPAWRLLGDAEVLFVSASVLAAFLLWRRLVDAWLAVALSVLTVLTWSDPRKAFEMFTLALFVPWVLEVFAPLPRRPLHWLPAGLLGGLIAVTYQAWMVYSVIGVLVLVVIAWRTGADRWAYLRRIALVVAVSFVVACWYVVPFGWASLTRGGQSISDLYVSSSVNDGLFPFLEPTPLGALQLVGLLGLLTLWRLTWWARSLTLLVIGVYTYRLLFMLRYLDNGHTGFMHYTARLYGVLFTVAGVLTLAHVVPLALRRLRFTPPRLAGAGLLAVLLAWSAGTFTHEWMPGAGSPFAVSAHTEPLPGGGYPVYAPRTDRRPWFPVTPVQEAVERTLGPDARPVTVAVDDRVFSYLPWWGFIDNDRTAGSTLSRWDDRKAALRRLATVTDPERFAAECADVGGFGPVDVFVLRRQSDGLVWHDVRFAPEQFGPAHWTVVDGLPDNVVVAIRR